MYSVWIVPAVEAAKTDGKYWSKFIVLKVHICGGIKLLKIRWFTENEQFKNQHGKYTDKLTLHWNASCLIVAEWLVTR